MAEILHPDREEPGADGELGELTVTALGRAGCPAIRYRTGDVVQCSTERCPAAHAGLWLPEGILGRTDDIVVIRGMNVFRLQSSGCCPRWVRLGNSASLSYADPAAMDGVQFEVEVEVELAQPSQARCIQARLRQRLGLRVRIVLLKPSVLAEQTSKSRRW